MAHWKPIDGAAEQDAGLPPIFITQRALAAVHDHCAATRETCFGLLAGKVYRAPDTSPAYVVVESTIRLPGVIGDDAKAALMQGWIGSGPCGPNRPKNSPRLTETSTPFKASTDP